ncbi:sigma-70 region 2 family protein [Aspergillus terreus]|uniref:Sigma-70 region 2 family protein n=1 Tax=Aspergillus terreus TaxID=33178 RepID=A0A5M3YTU6_ASPTE|nr:hypothetical protein ATETN484_0002076000 [Aspergillus terreus]GFF15616.1 sigma-70 region 2 family protein [Aspergillus terreus]
MSGSANQDSSATDPSPTRWQFIDASNNPRSNLTQVKRHVMQEYLRQKRQDAGDSRRDDEDAAEPAQSQSQSQRKARRSQRSKPSSKSTQTRKNATVDGPGQGAESKELQRHHGPPHLIPDEDVIVIDRPSLDGTSYTSTLPIISASTSSSSSQSPELFAIYASSDQSSRSDSTILTPPLSVVSSPFDRGLSPKTILSAARTDPFNTLPMELDPEGQRLFDFYVNEMPACSYGTHFRSPKAHNWYTAVFVPMGMKGAVAFQNTILVHAANTWAWVRNEEETDYTLIHRNRAISMLREHMATHPGDISDVAIIACLSAAGLEDFDPRPGHKPISWIHMRAAREMIRARGGPAAFENTRLGMLINWQDYILSGYETKGPSFFFEPTPPVSQPKDEIQHQCYEFLDFLRRCEHLALHQRSQAGDAHSQPRHAAFAESALLHRILAAPPGMRFTASGDRKQFVARLVALIMLNAALWDYRFSAAYTAAFLHTLERAVHDSEVSMSGSVEALLQIMLECKDGTVDGTARDGDPGSSILPSTADDALVADFSQYAVAATTPYGRPWFAGRMLKVAKRLSKESWMNVHDFLFLCLTLRVDAPVVAAWESALRREVLSAPLTSYVMPALSEC